MFIDTYGSASGYTPTVPAINGQRIVQLRKRAGFETQGALADKAGMDPSKLSRLENDKPVNLTLKSLERLAAALKVELRDLFELPRPEGATGHAAEDGPFERSELLGRALASIDTEFPADESWQGDIYKAIATLTRALRRGPTTRKVTGKTQKVGS